MPVKRAVSQPEEVRFSLRVLVTIVTALAVVSLMACSSNDESDSAPDSSNGGASGSAGSAGNGGSSVGGSSHQGANGGASGSGSHEAPPLDIVVEGVKTSDITIPNQWHNLGLSLSAKLFQPLVSGESIPLPVVIVVHGSGGLHKMPSPNEPNAVCSSELEPQFSRWGERLAQQGYVVVMPASFDSRGFCDIYEDQTRIPSEFDTPEERILGRLYDVNATSRYVCAQDFADCSHLGLLGFSNGASVVMLALHWQINRALEQLKNSADGIDFAISTVPQDTPPYTAAVSYYPGCGLESMVPFSVKQTDSDLDMYSPSAPLYIEHGSIDSLVDDCSEEFGQGRRQKQAALVAAKEGQQDRYSIQIHQGADHGFDNAGSGVGDEGSSSMRSEDIAARDAAAVSTLEHFTYWLGAAPTAQNP